MRLSITHLGISARTPIHLRHLATNFWSQAELASRTHLQVTAWALQQEAPHTLALRARCRIRQFVPPTTVATSGLQAFLLLLSGYLCCQHFPCFSFCPLNVVLCPLSGDFDSPGIIFHSLSSVFHPLGSVSRFLSIISCLLSIVSCPLSIPCPLNIIFHLLSIVSCFLGLCPLFTQDFYRFLGLFPIHSSRRPLSSHCLP
jgi:hypothetical protein